MNPDVVLAELELMREVARIVNRDLAPDDVLRLVADRLCLHERARRVTIWRRAPSGSRAEPISHPGDAPVPPSLDLDVDAPGVVRVPLMHAGYRLGTLEVEGGRPAGDETRSVVGEQVATYLDALLLSEDLADEVAIRTREAGAQRRLISLIIDSLPVGLYVVDREYRVQVWNRKRETGTQGVQRREVVGRRVFEVLTRQPPEQLRAELDAVFATGEPQQREQEVHVGSERRVFRQSKIPMRLNGREVTHVITIGEDVTERRHTEERILQSEKLAAVGQLAAGVMHEINNPLATIGACVAAIDARVGDAADATVREYLEIIDTEVQRCTRIVDQLLEFSRPRTDRPAPGPADVNALVEQTLFLLKHHQRFKRLAVERGFGAGLPRVMVDGDRIVQAFMAIMLNAADAMERGGTLRVRTLRNPQRPDEVVTELEDTGVGIPPSELDRIFEAFYTTKAPGRGTGLGLTIAYGIVEEQGGRLTVQSVPGQGATFRIFLPTSAGPAS